MICNSNKTKLILDETRLLFVASRRDPLWGIQPEVSRLTHLSANSRKPGHWEYHPNFYFPDNHSAFCFLLGRRCNSLARMRSDSWARSQRTLRLHRDPSERHLLSKLLNIEEILTREQKFFFQLYWKFLLFFKLVLSIFLGCAISLFATLNDDVPMYVIWLIILHKWVK